MLAELSEQDETGEVARIDVPEMVVLGTLIRDALPSEQRS